MENLLRPLADGELWGWEAFLDEWIFVLSCAFLVFELVRYAVKRKLSWVLVGDAGVSFLTLAFYIVISVIMLGTFYVLSYYYVQQFALFSIETNWVTVAICIVLADFAYYWEHRFSHRVGMIWATHSVHHSSEYFNISVANRFGPMDGIWPIFFHAPLVVAGFDPVVVIFSEAVVLFYQTFLHTEVIGKLPRPIEAIFNTPSHHRVHHGSNPVYLDKNYAGILIIWDRMFGTFAEEKEKVRYGLVKQLGTINPFVVYFHGFTRLAQEVAVETGAARKFLRLFTPPGDPPDNGSIESPMTQKNAPVTPQAASPSSK